MSSSANVTKVPLTIDKIPEEYCLEDGSFEDFLNAVKSFLSVEIPASVTNVVISNQEPTNRNVLWVRRSNSGVFIGFYLFSGNSWNVIWPTPGGIFWVYSADGSVPAGYELIDASGPPVIPDYVRDSLVTQYVLDQATNNYYVYFAVRWVGL